MFVKEKFEYKTIINEKEPLTDNEINRLGCDGWKLISFVIDKDIYVFYYIFIKRIEVIEVII